MKLPDPMRSATSLTERLDRRAALVLFALFALSRLGYFLNGLKFDASPLRTFMQFIDEPLLADRLLESTWYSHAHPPILNLFAGVGLKLFGEHADWFYAVSFHLLGYGLALGVFVLIDKLTHCRLPAYIGTGLLVASPAFVLYENWLMYTFPAAVLLVVSTVVLARFLDDRRVGRAVLFFSLLALLALTRSLFHLFWLVGIALMLFAVLRANRRQIFLAALAPVIVVAGWYGKNYVLYGSFAGSSMLGLGLSNITTLTATREELMPLVERGKLSSFALLSRYPYT
jgi:hypothetical protein